MYTFVFGEYAYVINLYLLALIGGIYAVSLAVVLLLDKHNRDTARGALKLFIRFDLFAAVAFLVLVVWVVVSGFAPIGLVIDVLDGFRNSGASSYGEVFWALVEIVFLLGFIPVGAFLTYISVTHLVLNGDDAMTGIIVFVALPILASTALLRLLAAGILGAFLSFIQPSTAREPPMTDDEDTPTGELVPKANQPLMKRDTQTKLSLRSRFFESVHKTLRWTVRGANYQTRIIKAQNELIDSHTEQKEALNRFNTVDGKLEKEKEIADLEHQARKAQLEYEHDVIVQARKRLEAEQQEKLAELNARIRGYESNAANTQSSKPKDDISDPKVRGLLKDIITFIEREAYTPHIYDRAHAYIDEKAKQGLIDPKEVKELKEKVDAHIQYTLLAGEK